MNRTKIDWCDFTWNPVTGCWGPGGTPEKPNWCPYCYARTIAARFNGTPQWPKGFVPMLRPERLSEPAKRKKPARIFVCSMADLFGDWVPLEWIGQVYEACRNAPWHQYYFLTKNQLRYEKIHYSDFQTQNWYWGQTIVDSRNIQWISDWISFEPLLGPIDLEYFDNARWFVIGADSRRGAIAPKREWVDEIVDTADQHGIPVFIKDNLRKHYPDAPWANRREHINERQGPGQQKNT